MKILYLFDITGRLLNRFKAKDEREALQLVLTFLRINWRAGQLERQVSTQERQICLHKSYYVTFEEHFIVDYSQHNHNPLRPDRLQFPPKIFTDLGGGLLVEAKTMENGSQRSWALDKDKVELWNDVFLQKKQLLYNPYYGENY